MIAAVLFVLGGAGCGGGSARSSTSTPTAQIASHPAVPCAHLAPRRFAQSPAGALASMKQEAPSLIWQSVFVRANATGMVTTLVGEITGAQEVPFRLAPAQLTTLKRLVSQVRSSHRSSAIGHHPGYTYLIHVRGEPSIATDETTPTRYGALARFLNAVMVAHGC